MKKLQQISGNELSELRALLYRLNEEIRGYSHVSELLPTNLTNAVNSFTDKLEVEYKRREDEQFN